MQLYAVCRISSSTTDLSNTDFLAVRRNLVGATQHVSSEFWIIVVQVRSPALAAWRLVRWFAQ
jgi:hypothetical protein